MYQDEEGKKNWGVEKEGWVFEVVFVVENYQFWGVDFEKSPQMGFGTARKFGKKKVDAEGVHLWAQVILAVGDVVWCL